MHRLLQDISFPTFEIIKMVGAEIIYLLNFWGRSKGAPGAWAPRPPNMRPQHQNSTKLRPQNGSFRP